MGIGNKIGEMAREHQIAEERDELLDRLAEEEDKVRKLSEALGVIQYVLKSLGGKQ